MLERSAVRTEDNRLPGLGIDGLEKASDAHLPGERAERSWPWSGRVDDSGWHPVAGPDEDQGPLWTLPGVAAAVVAKRMPVATLNAAASSTRKILMAPPAGCPRRCRWQSVGPPHQPRQGLRHVDGAATMERAVGLQSDGGLAAHVAVSPTVDVADSERLKGRRSPRMPPQRARHLPQCGCSEARGHRRRGWWRACRPRSDRDPDQGTTRAGQLHVRRRVRRGNHSASRWSAPGRRSDLGDRQHRRRPPPLSRPVRACPTGARASQRSDRARCTTSSRGSDDSIRTVTRPV
jgi:hypothetical protein